MSTGKLPSVPSRDTSLTLDDITQVVSSSAIIRAMQKVDMNYEPSEKEKLDEILSHPELLARAVGLIINGATDKDIAKVLDIKPFTVGYIRENEFVRILCDECFKDNIAKLKNGLSTLVDRAVVTFNDLLDPESHVTDKTRYMAANALVNTLLRLNGEFKAEQNKLSALNITQINNNVQPDAKEAYERALRDMESIMPVANNIYGGDDSGE